MSRRQITGILILLSVIIVAEVFLIVFLARGTSNPSRGVETGLTTLIVTDTTKEEGDMDWTNRAVIVDTLYQTMKDVHDVLVYTGIHYVIESGTLLGAVRNKGLIPDDDDVDIQVQETDRSVLEKYAFRRIKKLGYDTVEMSFGYKVFPSNAKVIPGFNFKFPSLDIFMTSITDGKTHNTLHQWPHCYFTTEEYFPVKLYEFGPLQLYGPTHADNFLTRCYGSDWNEVTYTIFDHSTETTLPMVKVALTPQTRLPSLPSKPLQSSKYTLLKI